MLEDGGSTPLGKGKIGKGDGLGGRQARINIIKASIDQSGPSNDQEDKYTELWTRREERLR